MQITLSFLAEALLEASMSYNNRAQSPYEFDEAFRRELQFKASLCLDMAQEILAEYGTPKEQGT